VIRGEVYWNNRDYDMAIADFAEVVALRPVDSAAYRLRAKAYAGKGEHEKAMVDLGRAARLDSTAAESSDNQNDALASRVPCGKTDGNDNRAAGQDFK
jgi:Flp pilus assembly protein TadD